jgi:hypothetical protein
MYMAAICAIVGMAGLGAAPAASAASKSSGPELFISGRLADYDHRPLEVQQASADILAVGSAHSGIARIEVAVDGKQRALGRPRCRPSCPSSARLAFSYRKGRFGPGDHKIVVTATDESGHTVRDTISVSDMPVVSSQGGAAPSSVPYLPASNAVGLPRNAVGNAAHIAITAVTAMRQVIGAEPKGPPDAQPAFYMTASNAADLRRQAAADAARFARGQGDGPALLLLDFGAARHRGKQWGTSLRDGPFFSNQDIASALEAAARAYDNAYRQGDVTIVYSTTNAHLGDPGPGYRPLNVRTAREAGHQQAVTIDHLHLYSHESAASGGDIEPGYPNTVSPKVTIALVQGAAAGGDPYYDVGTAPCTGDTCVNGWTVRDVCAVTTGGGRLAIPEIYFETPIDQSVQWAAVQKKCGIPVFAGASASLQGHFEPNQSWTLLGQRANVGVGPALVVFPE